MLTALVLVMATGSVLEVGDGKTYPDIESAVAAAHEGDTVQVYPQANAYRGAHVLVKTPKLTIRGIGTRSVPVEGGAFEYSGEGSVPRAIFQVEAAAHDVTIENFDLSGARNGSHNGAGVRINAANRVTIRNCEIHDNDMGIMSNGIEKNQHAGEDQLIDGCRIHGNGSAKDPGYNHNLYLGGTSATVQFCDIYASTTGHNLKSRAHYTVVQYCHIHQASNREIDLVEAWDTERAHSNAVLLGNVIEKDLNCPGNRTVVHFGQEKGLRDGTLFMLNNTIRTPFQSPVVDLDGAKVRVAFFNNKVRNGQQAKPLAVGFSRGADSDSVTGEGNWFSDGYVLPGALRSVPANSLPALSFFEDGFGKRQDGKPAFRWDGARSWKESKDGFLGAG